MSSPTLLTNLLLFINTLRRVGIPVSIEQSLEATQALTWVEIGERDQVYHTLRSLLVKRKEELALFEILFNRFWRIQEPVVAGQKMPIAPRHNLPEQRATIVTLMAQRAKAGDPERDVADKSGTGSNAERLQHKAFGLMTAEELEAIKRLLSEMHWSISLRKTHRRTPDPQGERLHLRAILRNAVKYQGVPLYLPRQSHKFKRRPLVILADISGSMEKYARLLLQFAYALSQRLGGYGSGGVESFVFGTRLTRLTEQLKTRNIDIALADAAHQVLDWAGGTRIGDCLHRFNIDWSRRVLRRGAIVLIVSDGCDCGESATLKEAMRALHHRCHRLIWLNPLAGDPRYQPLVAGMSTAMPFIDDFLPIHNLQSLEELSKCLEEM